MSTIFVFVLKKYVFETKSRWRFFKLDVIVVDGLQSFIMIRKINIETAVTNGKKCKNSLLHNKRFQIAGKTDRLLLAICLYAEWIRVARSSHKHSSLRVIRDIITSLYEWNKRRWSSSSSPSLRHRFIVVFYRYVYRYFRSLPVVDGNVFLPAWTSGCHNKTIIIIVLIFYERKLFLQRARPFASTLRPNINNSYYRHSARGI